MELPTLNKVVLDTLDFFAKNPPPTIDLNKFNMPIVVGSGNAANTGRIMFSGRAAIFADESNFKATIESFKPVIEKGLITQVIVISASGEKDSVWEVELAKELKLHTTLLTCKPESTAAKLADDVVVFRSIAEPYTYNTSTYLGMILATTNEKPEEISVMVETLQFPKDFDQYQSYAFVLPDADINIAPMIIIKGEELFGPHVPVRAYTHGHARHAKFVHPWEKELIISFGSKNEFFGDPNHRWDIMLPETASFGATVVLSYFICGKIQSSHTPYYFNDIENFCNDYGPKAYGKQQKFDVIVPAN